MDGGLEEERPLPVSISNMTLRSGWNLSSWPSMTTIALIFQFEVCIQIPCFNFNDPKHPQRFNEKVSDFVLPTILNR